jgi:exonuclease VII large subunit
MASNAAPWVQIGDGPPAGFFDADLPGLAPDQAAAIRSLELAEKAEERERQERLAERMEQSHNRAIMEAIQRAHAAGEAWNPSDPWRHYPSHSQRVEEVFAYMDMQAAAELRQAKATAVRVLREHGVNAQVVVDASQPRPQLPGGSLEPAAGEQPPSPGTSLAGASSGTAQRARVPALGPGVPRGPGEAQYVRMRVRRFLDRTRKVNAR